MFTTAPPEAEARPAPATPETAPWSASAERPAFLGPTPEPRNGAATTSLVCGIIGLLVVVFTLGGGFWLSLPFSIVAWLKGATGRRDVASGAVKTGDATAHAGRVLGIVGVVLAVIGVIVWFLILASVDFDVDELRRQLEERGR
jgi:predicted secreted protein